MLERVLYMEGFTLRDRILGVLHTMLNSMETEHYLK